MEYRTFRNEISNLNAYYKSRYEIEAELETMFYDLTGVKGVRYDKLPASYNPSLSEQTKLELLDKIEEKEKELDYTLLAIDRYERNLNRLSEEIKGYVERLFILGETFERVSRNAGYSKSAILYRIKAEVEKL